MITAKYSRIEIEHAVLGMTFEDHEIDYLDHRLPLGHVRLQLPKNAVGPSLGIAFAPAFLCGNRVDVRLSSTQERLASLIEEMFEECHLTEARIVRDDAHTYIRQSISGEYNGLHVFGHDRNITPWVPNIVKSIEEADLDVFIAEFTG